MAQQTRSFLRRPAVKDKVGLSRTSIYDRIKKQEFPAPVSLGARAVAWTSDSIENWIESRIKAAAAVKGGA